MILHRMGIPIYLQVKTHILDKIKAGDFPSGTKIPTERELAAELGISRNTVSAAYKELLLEGVLEARQGRGTFVKAASSSASEDDSIAGSKRDRLAKIIDDAMAKASELGFTVEQFAAITHIRAQIKTMAVRTLRVAIVDCTAEFTHRFAAQISQHIVVHCEEVLLADVEQGKVPIELLQACDLVVTTMEHHAALLRLHAVNHKLMAIAAIPRLEAVIQLARISHNQAVGVIAKSNDFFRAIKRLLSRINVSALQLEPISSLEKETLRRFINSHSVLVVSEEMEAAVRQLAGDNQEIIVFTYEIDQGSINQLMARLVIQAQ